jgi:hypothetical protein
LANLPLIRPRLQVLQYRLGVTQKTYRDEIRQMIGLDPELGRNAPAIFETFLDEAERIFLPSLNRQNRHFKRLRN